MVGIELMLWGSTEWVDASKDGVPTENVLECPGNVKWDDKLSVRSQGLMNFEALGGTKRRQKCRSQ